MARFPIVGGDTNTWGPVLNDLLAVGHNADGTPKGGVTVFNPKDETFGAKGDNATDDTTALQAWINAIQAVGTGTYHSIGAVGFLPPGTYITQELTVTWPITIIGSGWGSCLKLKNGANTYAIRFTPGGSQQMIGCHLSNFKIDCNGNNQSAGSSQTSSGGIYAVGAIFSTFDRLWIHNPYMNGLFPYQDGLGGYGHHNVIRACFFDLDVSVGGDGRAIRFDQTDENTIEHCMFQGNGMSSAGEPNHVLDLAGLNMVSHCQFVTGMTAIKFQGSHNRAIGNVFDGCGQAAAHQMRLNGSENTIIGNYFFNIGYNGTANSCDGLWIDNVSDNLVEGNFFGPYASGSGCRSGVNLSSGPATNNLVAGNKFVTLDGGSFGTGAVIPGTGTGNRIIDNPGYNPLGAASITVTASPFTYTAGPCPESVYVSGGTVSGIVKNSVTLASTTNCHVTLQPWESVTVTYSSPPTMAKDRH